MAGKNMGH